MFGLARRLPWSPALALAMAHSKQVVVSAQKLHRVVLPCLPALS